MAIFICNRGENNKMAKQITIEYRNKYVDGKRHLCMLVNKQEVRLCDLHESSECTLTPARHQTGKTCKGCEARLALWQKDGKVIYENGKCIVVTAK